jgi:hypothetical protein
MNIKMQCRGVRTDYLAVHTSEGGEFNDMIFAIHTDPTAKEDWSDVPNVILDPNDALQLAIELMDWARDHLPAAQRSEYTSNPQDWGFDDDEGSIGEWR